MFEGIVGKLIGQYLSEFLEDFDPSQLKIGLWDGKLELHHLKLNPSLLAARNIPFAFKASSVGLLRIEVPMISWSKGFFNDPLRISLANVVVTVVQSFRAFDRVVYAEKMERIKQSAIEALNEKIPSSFTASNLYYQHKLLQKLIDNIEISVEDVQVTYESPCGRSIGFSFDSFSLFTCNSLWEPAFQREAHDQVYKMIKMVGLRVEAKNLDEEVDSILKPLDASVKVVLHKPSVPDMNHSKVKANILVPSLSATLHQYQFALVLDVAHYVAVKQKREHFSGLPSPKERPDKDPAAWWRLAASDILQGIRKRRARFHPDVMLERKKNKRKYVKAFQEQVLSGKPNPEVTDLEKQLSIADIIYFRALSNVSLDRRATEPTKSWFQSSWFGGASPISIGEWLPSHDLSAAEKLALKKALELPSAPPMPPCDLPKDYVQVDLGMEVGSISLLLKEDREHGIVRLSSSAILSSCVLRPTSMTAAFEVGDIQVQNLLPTAPGYDQMVIRSRELGCTAQVDSPLLSMRVDVAPIERDADFGVEFIAPIPLDILIDSRMINKLIAFGLGTVKQRMRGFIEFGLKALKENIHIQGFVHDFSMKEEPVRVHLLVDAYTPRLIFPQDIGDCTKPSLLLHAGCFRFESRLDHLNDGKPENLDLSDQYQFNISGMRAALSPYSPLADRSIPQDHYMVPPLNISIQMSVLRPAATPQLAKVGLKVHVPAVAANIRLNEMQDIVGIIVGIVDDIRLAVLAVDDDYFYLQELVGVGVEKSEEALSRFTDNKLQQGKWKKVMLSVEANVPKITVILRDNLASSHVHTFASYRHVS